MPLTPRAGLVAVVVAAFAALAPPARADDVTTACVNAHYEGQKLRDAGKIRSARQQFLVCADGACPSPLRRDCSQWMTEAQEQTPTLLITGRGARGDGDEIADVAVSFDGETLLERLTGMPVEVDPGEHTLRFKSADGRVREQRIMLTAGDKNRRVVVDFNEPVRPAPSSPASEAPGARSPLPVPAPAIVLGSVALVAAAAFGFFGIRALTSGNHLKDTCAPTCSGDDASGVHRDAMIADVSLGVGIVALAAAVWIYATRPHLAAAGAPTPVSAPW